MNENQDDKRRDEILKLMLNVQPQKHNQEREPGKPSPRMRSEDQESDKHRKP